MKFTIDTWKQACEKMPKLTIKFKPIIICSWRGAYDEPCLIIEFTKDNHELEDILPFLEKLLQEDFQGYKGGEYTYNTFDDLNIELHYSDYTSNRVQTDIFVLNPILYSLLKEIKNQV